MVVYTKKLRWAKIGTPPPIEHFKGKRLKLQKNLNSISWAIKEYLKKMVKLFINFDTQHVARKMFRH